MWDVKWSNTSQWHPYLYLKLPFQGEISIRQMRNRDSSTFLLPLVIRYINDPSCKFICKKNTSPVRTWEIHQRPNRWSLGKVYVPLELELSVDWMRTIKNQFGWPSSLMFLWILVSIRWRKQIVDPENLFPAEVKGNLCNAKGLGTGH